MSPWVTAYVVVSPLVYLSFSGWDSMNLIDTRAFDRLAFWFWAVSVTAIVVMNLSQ